MRHDPHSYFDDAQPRTRHVSLALEVDFSRQVLAGAATLTLTKAASGTLDLDTKLLTIRSVKTGDGRAVPYSLGEKGDAALAQDPGALGKYYHETLALTKAALADIKTLVPGSDGKYVLAGFGWHQGWNDRISDKFNAEYEANMVNFIKDIRKEFEVPALPFVIAETGMTGPEEKNPRALSLMKAQAAAADRPEFKGTVAFVKTQAFWRAEEESPSKQGYHWNTNAETYYLIGDAMGEAMKTLLKNPK